MLISTTILAKAFKKYKLEQEKQEKQKKKLLKEEFKDNKFFDSFGKELTWVLIYSFLSFQ